MERVLTGDGAEREEGETGKIDNLRSTSFGGGGVQEDQR